MPAGDRALSDDEERPAVIEQRTAPAPEQAAPRTALDGAAAADRAEAAADRANAQLVLVVLLIDSALLAMLELMFLTASVGRVPLPLGALVALVSMPWLVRRAGELAGVAGASAPVVMWLVTVGVLSFAGPGGDVLLVGDWQTLLLLAAALLPGAFVLGRVIRAHREPPARREPPATEAPADPGGS